MQPTQPPTKTPQPPPPAPPQTTFFAKNNRLYHAIPTPFGNHYVPHEIIPEPPPPTITITPISCEDWIRISSFMKWSLTTYGKEALIHGYLNATTKTWFFEPPHQQSAGLTVETEPYHERNVARISELEQQGFDLRFTLHHHCNIAASQSGTDRSDEHSKPSGFHVTLGNLSAASYSIHHRLVLRVPGHAEGTTLIRPAETIQIEAPHLLDQMFESPTKDLPPSLSWVKLSTKDFLTFPHDSPFPEEWKTAIQTPAKPTIDHNQATVSADLMKLLEYMTDNPDFIRHTTQLAAQGEERLTHLYRAHDNPYLCLTEWRGYYGTITPRAAFDAFWRMYQQSNLTCEALFAELAQIASTSKRPYRTTKFHPREPAHHATTAWTPKRHQTRPSQFEMLEYDNWNGQGV